MTLSANTTVSDAFDQFQAQGQELSLVVQDGEVVGLLTRMRRECPSLNERPPGASREGMNRRTPVQTIT